MKKVLPVLLAVAVVFTMIALAKDKPAGSKTMKGWISDSKCGANGAKAGHEDCAKKCVQMGEKLVFVPDGKDSKVLQIDNQDAVTAHAGHHVDVKGTVNNDTLHVDSVTMLADNSKAGAKPSK